MGRGYYRAIARAIANRQSLWWLLLAGLGFRGLIAYFLPPGFDEAYYFLYTRHLAWSYFDHPLAVAFSTGLGVWLTGWVSPFTLRLGALTLFTGSLWLLYETGRWLFGRRAAWLSGAIASLCPLFLLTFGTLTAPDNALIFCWSGTLYLCAREFFPYSKETYQPTPTLVMIGLALGCCCLSKYHGFLLALALVCFCLSSPEHRLALRSRWLGLGVIWFCLSLFPIVYWNAQHEWISFQFQLSDRFVQRTAGYSLSGLLGGLLAQIGFLFPSLALPLWWTSFKQLAKTTYDSISGQPSRNSDRQAAKVSFLLWAGLPVAVGFTLLGGWTHTYPAWPAPGLWTLTLLLGRTAASWPHNFVRRWLQSTGLLVGILLIFALTHITFGTLQKPSQYALLGGFVTPSQDPSTALIDVGQLRRQFAQSEAFQSAVNTTDFMVTHEFWLSGYVAMALPASIYREVASFTQDPRGSAFWLDSRQWLHQDAVFVSLADFSQSAVLAAIAPYFQSITPITEITTQRGGSITETFYLYRANNLIEPYPYPY
ncbi:MAG: glycosyltransferase family 39 protein [Phormidesmis sp.]